jgi:poly-gamma-glutamate synthesis protein (capsule biosynthesis protein)
VLSDLDRKDNSLRSLHMRGRASTANLLAEWGLTVANLANNHILEQGPKAALDTVQNLRQAGIQVIGAGTNNQMSRGLEPLFVEVKGICLAILGICLRDEKYAYDGGINESEAIEQIRQCREKADKVVLSVHWGDELIEYPGLRQRKLAAEFEKAGADIIMGHHPHVYQGLDKIRTMLIAYSLGNFIFDGFSKASGWSIIWSVIVRSDETVISEAIPIIRDNHFRPQLAKGSQKVELTQEIERRNQLCQNTIENEEVFLSEYNREVKTLRQKSRKSLWKNLGKRFFSFKPVFWPQLLMRPIQRRMGTW